jgi:two-component system sensor histidine kinase ChvG
MVEAARARSDGRITWSLYGEPASVWVPPGRLEQVFANLMDNAASFSPPGGTVSVEVSRAGDWVHLRVSDAGPGIPAEHRERIFDRFFSFRPGEERGVHAGLGLSIVKAIAESHGGSVSGESRKDGTGACFEVRLPAAG